jgi:hypothetical protein
MKRPCDVCGTVYEAKRKTSRYCSSGCRARKSLGAEVVELPPPTAGENEGGPCYAATLRSLTEASRHDTPLGAAALALARRIDSPGLDTGSALASLVGRLETTLATAMKGAGAATAPGQLKDELAARRAAHGA